MDGFTFAVYELHGFSSDGCNLDFQWVLRMKEFTLLRIAVTQFIGFIGRTDGSTSHCQL
jgi:hypothetical protein